MIKISWFEKSNVSGILFLLSVLFTNIGLGGYTLMTGVMIYDLTNSAVLFSSTLGVGFALDLIGQFFGGGFLDRLSPKKVCFYANVSRGLLIVAAGLHVLMTQEVIGVIIASLYMSTVGPVYRAGVFAIPPLIVQKERLSVFNAVRIGLMQVGQLVGLGIVTGMLAFLSREIVFVLVGLWFVLGGVFTQIIPGVMRGQELKRFAVFNPVHTIHEWRVLFRTFRSTPSIFAHIFVSSGLLVVPTIINLAVVPLNNELWGETLGLALLDGGYAVGAIVASIIFSRNSQLMKSPRFVVFYTLSISCGSLFFAGIVETIFLATMCFFLAGFSITGASVTLDTSLQLRLDESLLGRTALFQDACMSLLGISLVPFIGSIIDSNGIQVALIVGSCIAFSYLTLSAMLGAPFAFGNKLYEQKVNVTDHIQEKTKNVNKESNF